MQMPFSRFDLDRFKPKNCESESYLFPSENLFFNQIGSKDTNFSAGRELPWALTESQPDFEDEKL